MARVTSITLSAPLLAILLLFAGRLPAQQPVHVDVNLVNVAFSARNADGSLVDNLTQNDLELYEDGAAQKIAFFARSVDLPLTIGLIDDASSSQEHSAKHHKQDLEIFLREVLRPQDRAFLVSFGNHLRLLSDFTSDPLDIIAGLDRNGQKKHPKFPELGPVVSRDLGTAFYDSIFYSISEKLSQHTGRRALLVFSDGEDNSSSHDMMTTIEAAQRADVLVFAIRYTETNHGKLTPRNEYGIRVMDRIARETGGEHIDASVTDPHTYFRQIGEELRASYELAYYPTNPSRDEDFRKIKIVARQPGLRIRSKPGYFPK